MKFGSAIAVLILLTCLLSPAYGLRAYTVFGEFWNDTAELNIRYTINFDDLSSGDNASQNGITEIGTEGLLSDGSSRRRLTPTAGNKYMPYTAPNALGVADDNQFLSGNSDTVIFSFLRPIQAFGLFLIGNPSPTGDPPIPFWRMRINLPVPEVFSATEPIASLGYGDDLYFLGILSDEPFTEVQLFSDNDGAAVFSFNIDNVIWGTRAYETSLAEIRLMTSGSDVFVSEALVARVHSDRFNIQNKDRSSGITVLGSGAHRGEAVSLLGTVTTTSPDCERVVSLLQVIGRSPASPPPSIAMITRAMGGASKGEQIGCTGGSGLNNVGLDGTVVGRVTTFAADGSWMTLDHGLALVSGMGYPGVKVVGAIGKRRQGEMLRVSGSVSLFESDGKFYPLLRVADEKDVTLIEEH